MHILIFLIYFYSLTHNFWQTINNAYSFFALLLKISK